MKHYRENLFAFQDHVNKEWKLHICGSHGFSLGGVSIGRTKLSPQKENLRRKKENKDKLCCTLLALHEYWEK